MVIYAAQQANGPFGLSLFVSDGMRVRIDDSEHYAEVTNLCLVFAVILRMPVTVCVAGRDVTFILRLACSQAKNVRLFEYQLA